MARHRTSEEWSTILAAYANRTGTQAEFCREHGVSKSSLDYNLRKQRRDKTGRLRRSPRPRIVELPAQTAIAPISALDQKDAELSFHHRVLGELTIRCHNRDLSEVISHLSESR